MARLSDNNKRELCTLIATRMEPPDIKEHFKVVHGLDLTFQQIYYYRAGLGAQKWADFIIEERIKYDSAVEECYLSSKRNRVDACYTAYKAAKAKGDPKGMVMAIAQAQKEVEGNQLRLTNKEGEDFSFTINIGPPPEDREPRRVGPPATLLPFNTDEDED